MTISGPQPENQRAIEDALAWEQHTELRERLYGGATERMLAAAQLKPGDQVLDIAAGTGDQSRHAARLVGPAGSVLATDISPERIAVATRLAGQAGLSNITNRVMNAEQLDLPENHFDAVISRFGLMLIPQRQQALTEIRRVLKPDGRLAAVVWSTPEHNPLFIMGDTFEAQLLGTQATPGPDPFALADAEAFAGALTQAGFQEVAVQPLSLPFRFASLEALFFWWGPSFESALTTLDPESRQRIMEDIRQAVRPYEGPQGIEAPAEALLGVGRK